MKRHGSVLIMLSALMLAFFMAASFVSCSSDGGSSDDDSGSNTYIGTYTVDGKNYNKLTMDGTGDSGSATMTGSGGTLSGSYSKASSASVRALTLGGTYTISVSGGTFSATLNNDSITLSGGTKTANGGGVHMAGTYEGTWTNTALSQSGTMTLTVTEAGAYTAVTSDGAGHGGTETGTVTCSDATHFTMNGNSGERGGGSTSDGGKTWSFTLSVTNSQGGVETVSGTITKK